MSIKLTLNPKAIEGKFLVHNRETGRMMVMNSRLDEGKYLAIGRIEAGVVAGKPLCEWLAAKRKKAVRKP